jgi:DNA polymerase IV
MGLPRTRPRAILHLDLDAFFAAVEVLENPDLEGKPVVVGGRAEERGVVCSASYEARSSGVRSAMPTFRALALCPAAVVVAPRHALYRAYSRRVMAILHQASPLVEQISVDEAFVDVTEQISGWEEAIEVARGLQQRVRAEVRLSASLGVAANKLVAKVASDRDKPGGLTVVPPGQEARFLAPLPVRVLWGVGPVTAKKLAASNVLTVGDLAQLPEAELRARFGQHGAEMARQALGIDDRPLAQAHEPRSVSHETTFVRDIADPDRLRHQLLELSRGVARRLRHANLAAATVAIKIRYADLTTVTRQTTLAVPTDHEGEISRAALTLLQRAWKSGRPIRLLGVAGRNLRAPVGQPPLFPDDGIS